MQPDKQILADKIDRTFRELIAIDSESLNEGEIAEFLKIKLCKMGLRVSSDDAHIETGGNAGNLIAFLPGSGTKSFMLSAHMDTVCPGKGIRPNYNDGIYTSDGTTILGADDKAGIAIILETISYFLKSDLHRPGLEILFTVCEEMGLLGAKSLDVTTLRSKEGLILDSTNTDIIITKAPAANRLKITVTGLEAHAGVNPEKGINSIQLAARALSRIPMGRIDEETTANIGVINGGRATNIVASMVSIEGEVRSHDTDKLQNITNQICSIFNEEIDSTRKEGESLPKVEIEVIKDFPVLKVNDEGKLVKSIIQAGNRLERTLTTGALGGGSDANILNGKGIDVAVLGMGMLNPHSVKESIKLEDMVQTALLLIEIISAYPLEDS